MSDLQLALLALGAVFVAAVAGYNAWQERRARRRAEAAFAGGHADALLGAGAERREPVLGALPDEAVPDPALGAIDEVMEPVAGGAAVPAGAAAASSVVSNRIDTLALVLADEPVTRAQIEPLLDALQSHATPVNVEGLVDELWTPVEESARDSWRELRVGLQLASRWWPEAPDAAAWTDFARSAPGVTSRPDLADVPWLSQPWIEAQSPQALAGRWSRIEQLVAGVAAVGLVGLTAAQAADAYRVGSDAAMLSAELDRVRATAAPTLAARDKALATLGEIQALSRNLQGVQPIAVLRHLAEVLPAKGVTLREFDLSGMTLRLGLDLAPEVQRSAIVKDLQSGGWFAGVAEARDGGNRAGLTFEMRLNALQPPVVAPRAARVASAPGIASPTPKGAP